MSISRLSGNKLEHNTSGKNQKAITIQRICMIILEYYFYLLFFLLMLEERTTSNF